MRTVVVVARRHVALHEFKAARATLKQILAASPPRCSAQENGSRTKEDTQQDATAEGPVPSIAMASAPSISPPPTAKRARLRKLSISLRAGAGAVEGIASAQQRATFRSTVVEAIGLETQDVSLVYRLPEDYSPTEEERDEARLLQDEREEILHQCNRQLTPEEEEEMVGSYITEYYGDFSAGASVWHSRFDTQICQPGEVIIERGDPALKLFVVISGAVIRETSAEWFGDASRPKLLGVGSVFGCNTTGGNAPVRVPLCRCVCVRVTMAAHSGCAEEAALRPLWRATATGHAKPGARANVPHDVRVLRDGGPRGNAAHVDARRARRSRHPLCDVLALAREVLAYEAQHAQRPGHAKQHGDVRRARNVQCCAI